MCVFGFSEFTQNDNDEVFSGIAKQLGSFVELVGGTAHAACLLPLLEKFAAEEETVIRNNACASLAKIIPQLPAIACREELFPMIQRLVEVDWFTARCSSCVIIAASYEHLEADMQQRLRSWYLAMCSDETPMVKKAALKSLGDLCVKVDVKTIMSDFMPIIRELVTDDMDSVRVFAADICASLAQVLPAEEFNANVIPLLEASQEDVSWRVRCQFAIKIPLLVQNLPETSMTET